MMMDDSADLLDLKQLCTWLPISERTVRSLIHQSEDPLPAIRLGGTFIFNKKEVLDWLQKRRVSPVSIDQIIDDVLKDM